MKKKKANNYSMLPVGTNDSEVVVHLLKNFEYDPNKTEEILREYENSGRRSKNLVKVRKIKHY